MIPCIIDVVSYINIICMILPTMTSLRFVRMYMILVYDIVVS
jgi:hypothetical protein